MEVQIFHISFKNDIFFATLVIMLKLIYRFIASAFVEKFAFHLAVNFIQIRVLKQINIKIK